ncbi:LytTR family transcriptional regulator DNA-binding domain-containing protein [Salipiger manganoxidans]|nr:LytTR family transcriptional regulator DNA-binding domain-containing protein [Salipiger manganoxidans]
MSRVLLRGDRQIYCLRPLKHFEGMLVSSCHHRIDRFTILNIEAVRELRPMAGARGAVVLSDSEQVMTIGRAGTGRLRQLLANRTPSRAP